MADNKFDLNKLKESAGGLMEGLKSMINPAVSVPAVNPDDALGVKIAQIAVMIKQLSDAQQEQLKSLGKLNEMLSGAFQDIEALRNQIKTEKQPGVAEPVVPAEKTTSEEK